MIHEIMEKMDKPEAILFDWDSTLVDTFPAIRAAFKLTCQTFPLVDGSSLFQGHCHRSVKESFPILFGNREGEARDFFYQKIGEIDLKELVLLPGAFDLINCLHSKSIPLAVVSNKQGDILRKEINSLKMTSFFSFVSGSGDSKRDKPSPDPALDALTFMNKKSSLNIWFVGDSIVDWQCASLAGCRPVAIGLAPHTLEEKKGNNFLGFFSVLDCEKLRKIIEVS